MYARNICDKMSGLELVVSSRGSSHRVRFEQASFIQSATAPRAGFRWQSRSAPRGRARTVEETVPKGEARDYAGPAQYPCAEHKLEYRALSL